MIVYIVMDRQGFIPAVYNREDLARQHAKEIGGHIIERKVK